MTKLKLLSAAAILSALAVAPSLAQARTHHLLYHSLAPYEISYSHNYGPGSRTRHLRLLRWSFDQCLCAGFGDLYRPGPPQASLLLIRSAERSLTARDCRRRFDTPRERLPRNGARLDSPEQSARHHGDAGHKSDRGYPYRDGDVRNIRRHAAIAQPQQGQIDQREHRQRRQRGAFRKRRQRNEQRQRNDQARQCRR